MAEVTGIKDKDGTVWSLADTAARSDLSALKTSVASKADADDVYTKTAADALISAKADASDTYTKTEVDSLVAGGGGDLSGYYTSEQTDALLAKKQDTITVDAEPTADSANPVTSGGVYTALAGKEDAGTAYSKTETDTLLASKADASDIPAKLSALANDAGFITKAVGDLESYYLKSETYTQDEVKALVAAVSTLSIAVADELPTEDISATTIYFVPKTTAGTQNVYSEYVYINSAWELIGDTEIDLSDYYTRSEADALLGKKQDALDFDTAPTDSSANPVTSGGVKTALDGKQDKTLSAALTVDGASKATVEDTLSALASKNLPSITVVTVPANSTVKVNWTPSGSGASLLVDYTSRGDGVPYQTTGRIMSYGVGGGIRTVNCEFANISTLYASSYPKGAWINTSTDTDATERYFTLVNKNTAQPVYFTLINQTAGSVSLSVEDAETWETEPSQEGTRLVMAGLDDSSKSTGNTYSSSKIESLVRTVKDSSTGADLDDVTEDGIFSVNNPVNGPDGVSGWSTLINLRIDHNNNYIRQILIPISSETIYARYKSGSSSNSSWSSWYTLATGLRITDVHVETSDSVPLTYQITAGSGAAYRFKQTVIKTDGSTVVNEGYVANGMLGTVSADGSMSISDGTFSSTLSLPVGAVKITEIDVLKGSLTSYMYV